MVDLLHGVLQADRAKRWTAETCLIHGMATGLFTRSGLITLYINGSGEEAHYSGKHVEDRKFNEHGDTEGR